MVRHRDVRECIDSTANCMSYMYDHVLDEVIYDDGSFIDYFVQLPQPFQNSMPEDVKARLMTHAAWFDAEDHETVSISSVCTTSHPMGVLMYTRLYLMESPCDVVAWDTLARFVAYGGGGCTLKSYHALMSMASTRMGQEGALEVCIIVYVDTSERTPDSVMYGVAYRSSHSGNRYR